MDAYLCIVSKREVRKYTSKDIADDVLTRILQAGRATGNSQNRQRWEFVVVRGAALEQLADALPVERTASRWIVSADPEQQIEQIKPYLDLGFTNLIFHAPGEDQERFLRLYARDVLPRLRELAG